MAELVKSIELPKFKVACSSLPWSPGQRIDCCLVVAEWLMWLGHADPVPHLRGTYNPGQGQLEVLRRLGGVLGIFRGFAPVVGARPIDRPRCGDVGVVGSETNIVRQFGVIHDGEGWLTMTEAGFERVCARTLAAWEI